MVSGRGEEKRPDQEAGTARGVGHDGKASGPPPGPGQNILSLLTNAQKTYEQEHGASHDHSDPRPIKHASGDASGMSQISVEDLFRTVNQHQAKAGMVDMGTDTTKNPMFARSLSVTEVEAQPIEPSPPQDNRHPILKLISSKMVAEIEKQHIDEHKRAKGGGAGGGGSIPPEASPAAGRPGRSPGGATEGGSGIDLMQLLQGGAKQPAKPLSSEGDSGDKGMSTALDGPAVVKRLISLQDPQFGTNRGFIPVSLPSNAQSVDEIENSLGAMSFSTSGETTSLEKKDSPGVHGGTTASFPVLLKPSDLDPSLAKSISPPLGGSFSPSVNALLTPQAFSGLTDRVHSDSLLMSATSPPTITSTPAPASALASTTGLAPLTRDQLQQAMVHLVKNDATFLNTLHAAYLESFHAATSNKL